MGLAYQLASTNGKPPYCERNLPSSKFNLVHTMELSQVFLDVERVSVVLFYPYGFLG